MQVFQSIINVYILYAVVVTGFNLFCFLIDPTKYRFLVKSSKIMQYSIGPLGGLIICYLWGAGGSHFEKSQKIFKLTPEFIVVMSHPFAVETVNTLYTNLAEVRHILFLQWVFTIFGCYIQFHIMLITALYYFHDIY